MSSTKCIINISDDEYNIERFVSIFQGAPLYKGTLEKVKFYMVEVEKRIQNNITPDLLSCRAYLNNLRVQLYFQVGE